MAKTQKKHPRGKATPDSYEHIRDCAIAYRIALRDLGSGVITGDYTEETLAVIMDKQEVLSFIGELDSNDNLAAVIALDDDDKLTVCLLGVNRYNNVVTRHLDGSLDGHEVWPDKYILDDLYGFLRVPKKRKRK